MRGAGLESCRSARHNPLNAFEPALSPLSCRRLATAHEWGKSRASSYDGKRQGSRRVTNFLILLRLAGNKNMKRWRCHTQVIPTTSSRNLNVGGH
jgi:hypothetical protein